MTSLHTLPPEMLTAVVERLSPSTLRTMLDVKNKSVHRTVRTVIRDEKNRMERDRLDEQDPYLLARLLIQYSILTGQKITVLFITNFLQGTWFQNQTSSMIQHILEDPYVRRATVDISPLYCTLLESGQDHVSFLMDTIGHFLSDLTWSDLQRIVSSIPDESERMNTSVFLLLEMTFLSKKRIESDSRRALRFLKKNVSPNHRDYDYILRRITETNVD